MAIIAIAFCSCECPYGWDDDEDWYNAHEQNSSIHYRNDTFCANTLIGTWQCEYGFTISGYEFKQIVFMEGNAADITMAKEYDTDWYTYTYSYTYYGSTLKFSRSGSTLEFSIQGYIFPQLTIRDSRGTYTMKKVK